MSIDIYNSNKTTHTFNYLLNGRWHSGKTPDIYGQLAIEHMIINLSGMNKHSRVLDFGCGNGLVSCDYNILTGAKIYGVTNNFGQIKCARMLTKNLKLTDVNFTGMNSLTLPFCDNYFDIVVFTESTCHICDKTALFREFYRVIKPGGKLVGEDWTTLNNSATSEIDNAYGTYLKTPKYYRNLADSIGFTEVVTETIIPQWDSGLGLLLSNGLKMSYYAFMYPNLPLKCPFKINCNMIDHMLLNAGMILQKNTHFRLMILRCQV